LKINDFEKDLKFSEEAGCENFWQSIYQKSFPDMISAFPTLGKCQGQMLGIDRVIQLKSGKTIYIDEKKRREVWGDISLEYKSNSNSDKNNGWMNKDLLIDYLAYAFMPIKTVYLFNWLLLRKVWLDNGAEWMQKAKNKKNGFRIVPAQNYGYTTLSIAVPIPILLEKLQTTMIVKL
jgi:hypothetical protein